VGSSPISRFGYARSLIGQRAARAISITAVQ
jgi:hypothetical protein